MRALCIGFRKHHQKDHAKLKDAFNMINQDDPENDDLTNPPYPLKNLNPSRKQKTGGDWLGRKNYHFKGRQAKK